MTTEKYDLDPDEYVSGIIDKTIYTQWKAGQRVIIKGSPNTGKTEFAVNYLNNVGGNGNGIYITNRNISTRQMQYKYGAKMNFKMEIYLHLIEDVYFKRSILNTYEYIVVDEAHSFFTDSYFESHLDLLLNYFLDNCPDSVILFLSSNSNLLETYKFWRR